MIIEQRTYTLQVGKLRQYYEAYGEGGLPVQSKILGEPIGVFHSELGPLNQVVSLWGYASFADREQRRAEIATNEAWLNYLRNSPPVILNQENRILVPAPFSRIR